jgi:very-short-patch-repair endonuclease
LIFIWFPFPLGKGLGVRLSSTTDTLMTRSSKITSGQNVHPDKLAFAKQLRREMTPAERRLWRALRGNALDGLHFRRQHVIEGYIADFYCDAAKLAIELDGGVHQEQWQYDESRDKAISSLGVTVLRISNDAMTDVGAVIEHIRQVLITPKNLTPNPFPRGNGNKI